MNAVIVAIEGERAHSLPAELEDEGLHVVASLRPDELGAASPSSDLLAAADVLLITPSRRVLTPSMIAACDRAAVRIVALGGGETRLLARHGLPLALPADAPAWTIAKAIADDRPDAAIAPPPAARSRVLGIWGPHGAPGRTTLAIQLAVELTRTGRRTALIDADTTAPSVSVLLGLGEESPGIAAACRRAELGSLDESELTRLATSVETSGGALSVLPGVNRPGRWPELGAARLRRTLEISRDWAEETVVDVSASFEDDDDGYDPAAPARHAATGAVLREADEIIAIASADPVGISRFLRGHAELRRIAGDSAITVVVNQVRPGPLGLDARGQIRRTLQRFAGIDGVTFLPYDRRGVDAALLHARPIADVTPRSHLAGAVRRLAASLGARNGITGDSQRGSFRVSRLLR